ncbi:hypothetical protein, partial [Eikenella corrodens]|uniref:hypothetical protein n=1 Tax=Eikenella corrodens TaxID=539 RepID=UPI0028EF55B1
VVGVGAGAFFAFDACDVAHRVAAVAALEQITNTKTIYFMFILDFNIRINTQPLVLIHITKYSTNPINNSPISKSASSDKPLLSTNRAPTI